MKIDYIKTKGFRSHEEIFETDLYDITNITGKNRSGKSNILYASINIVLGTNLSGDEKQCLINKKCDTSYGELHFIDNTGMKHTIIRSKNRFDNKGNMLLLDGKPVTQTELVSFYKDKKLFLSIINPLYFLSKKLADQKELVDKYLSDIKPKEIFDRLSKEEQNLLLEKYYKEQDKTFDELTEEEQTRFVNINMYNICMDIAYNNLELEEKSILEGMPSDIPTYVNDLNKEIKRAEATIATIVGKIEYADRFITDELPKKKKLIYIPAERQNLWLDILEEDGRGFCKLFATLLQTGMRPEEGCGLLLSNIAFDRDMVYVGNAHKEITLYDYNFNVIGHESVDDGLKTDESYREIPMNSRLKKMLEDIYNERKELRISQNKKFEPEKEYAFLNTEGGPFLPERLDKKLKSIMHKYNLEHMTVYGFRHSFATLMSENGMDKEVLREIMGHADFETTDFYYIFISDKRKKEELMKAHKNAFGKQQLNDVQKNEQIDENSGIKKVKFTGKIIKKKKIKAPLGKSA